MKKFFFVLAVVAAAMFIACSGGHGSSDKVRICSNCAGSGKYTCPTCNGAGGQYLPNGNYILCPSCAGYGKITCPYCDGEGTIAVN